jgi:hypothetical protein
MTKGRREGEGRHAIGERGGGEEDSRITQGDEAIEEEEEERMSVVVEETENRNSFAGTGETTRREGICMRDAEKERRWSAMNGRITHRGRGGLRGRGNEAARCCPMANRSTASLLPRICHCPGHATAECSQQNGSQRSHCQWKKLKGRSTVAAQRREKKRRVDRINNWRTDK